MKPILFHQPQYYYYRGDRLTDPQFKNSKCRLVKRPDGKAIRGRNGSILVEFEIPYFGPDLSWRIRLVRAVVIGQLLRKQFKPHLPYIFNHESTTSTDTRAGDR